MLGKATSSSSAGFELLVDHEHAVTYTDPKDINRLIHYHLRRTWTPKESTARALPHTLTTSRFLFDSADVAVVSGLMTVEEICSCVRLKHARAYSGPGADGLGYAYDVFKLLPDSWLQVLAN